MCWSPEASVATAGLSVGAVVYCVKTKQPWPLSFVLAYFALMEIIQAVSYSVIDECQNPANQALTLLAYSHISLQPIVINMLTLQYIPDVLRKRIRWFVYGVAGLMSLAIMVRIMPLEWQLYCYNILYYVPGMPELTYTIPFCGKETCTVSGEWHLAWQIPAGYNWMLDRAYIFGVFILPFIYGCWRVALYCAVVGPGITWLITDNANEFAAVWCLLSVGVIGLILIRPIRNLMRVHSWYGWKKGCNTEG